MIGRRAVKNKSHSKIDSHTQKNNSLKHFVCLLFGFLWYIIFILFVLAGATIIAHFPLSFWKWLTIDVRSLFLTILQNCVKVSAWILVYYLICRAQHAQAKFVPKNTRVTLKLSYKSPDINYLLLLFFLTDRLSIEFYFARTFKSNTRCYWPESYVICDSLLFFLFDTLQQICRNSFTSLNCSLGVEMCQKISLKKKEENKNWLKEMKLFPWITILI